MISELENSWRNLIQLIALKSETGFAYIYTYIQDRGNVGELLDNYSRLCCVKFGNNKLSFEIIGYESDECWRIF
jgi:hypothetical protein